MNRLRVADRHDAQHGAARGAQGSDRLPHGGTRGDDVIDYENPADGSCRKGTGQVRPARRMVQGLLWTSASHPAQGGQDGESAPGRDLPCSVEPSTQARSPGRRDHDDSLSACGFRVISDGRLQQLREGSAQRGDAAVLVGKDEIARGSLVGRRRNHREPTDPAKAGGRDRGGTLATPPRALLGASDAAGRYEQVACHCQQVRHGPTFAPEHVERTRVHSIRGRVAVWCDCGPVAA